MGNKIDKLNIKKLNAEDRPYEKLLKKGAEGLTDAELLAIIIKTGNSEENSLELAKRLLSKKTSGMSGYNYLKEVSIDELKSYKGIGNVKAILIKATIELAKRINSTKDKINKISSPKDVYELLNEEMNCLKTEEIRLILLDTKNKIKSICLVSKGSINQAGITLKEVLTEPIKQLATSIILVHNHPSGDSTPSKQDIMLTRKIREYADLFDITLLDHIVIGKDEYTSIRKLREDIFIKGRLI